MIEELIIDKNLKNEYKDLGMKVDGIQFKRHYLAGNLDLSNISSNYLDDIRTYYRQFTNNKINLMNHIVYKNITGMENVRILSREVLRGDLIPFFNDRGMVNTYTDKNFYDILFPQFNQPYTVIKKVRGKFFTKKNNHISHKEAEQLLLNDSPAYIIKSSDIENGKSINKLTVESDRIFMDNTPHTLEQIKQNYGNNFTIQRIIKQHPIMAKLHPSSVNTLRIVTLRWKGEINHIYTFCRFGVDGSIKDNAGRGGIVVGVKDNGEFMDFGANKYSQVSAHPTTNIKIDTLDKVPNYNQCIQLAKDMHQHILHQDFISWDIAIEKDGTPIFVEANFLGSAILNQIALERPLFGDLTDEILSTVYKELPALENYNTITNYSKLEKRFNRRVTRLAECRARNKRLRTKQKDYKKQLKASKKKAITYESTLKHTIDNYENKLEDLQSKYDIKKKNVNQLNDTITELQSEISRIKNSRSWRYTSFLRKK